MDTIAAWVAAGVPEGDARDLPPKPEFTDGWNIGKPDLIIDFGTEFEVPTQGVVPYQYFKVPTNFTEDKWIEAAKIRPQHRNVTHHINVFVLEPGQKNNDGAMLTGFAPGVQPLNLEPGSAMLVKTGSVFLFQAHYTTNGSSVGTVASSACALRSGSPPCDPSRIAPITRSSAFRRATRTTL